MLSTYRNVGLKCVRLYRKENLRTGISIANIFIIAMSIFSGYHHRQTTIFLRVGCIHSYNWLGAYNEIITLVTGWTYAGDIANWHQHPSINKCLHIKHKHKALIIPITQLKDIFHRTRQHQSSCHIVIGRPVLWYSDMRSMANQLLFQWTVAYMND